MIEEDDTLLELTKPYCCLSCGSDRVTTKKNTYTCIDCGHWWSDPDESDWFGENDDLGWMNHGNFSHLFAHLPG